MESVGVRGGESCQSSEGLAGAQTDLPTHSLWNKCWSNATGRKPRAREVGKASHPLRLQPFLIRHLQLQNNLRSLRFLSTCTLESYKQILCSRRRSSYLTALKKQKQTQQQQQRKLNRQIKSFLRLLVGLYVGKLEMGERFSQAGLQFVLSSDVFSLFHLRGV